MRGADSGKYGAGPAPEGTPVRRLGRRARHFGSGP